MKAGDAAYQKGKELAAAEKESAALVAFEEAFKENPKNAKAAFAMGIMLQRLGRHTNAVAALSKAVRLRPTFPQGYYFRAVSYLNLERYADALDDLDRAVELRPEHGETMYARGISLKNLGRHAEALEAFSLAISQPGRHAGAFYGRATIRSMMGDYVGAIGDFSDCIADGFDNYDVRLLRGLALYRVRRHAEALEDLSRAISLRPDVGSTYIRRWNVYKALGDEARAARDWAEGMKLLSAEKGSRGAANPESGDMPPGTTAL